MAASGFYSTVTAGMPGSYLSNLTREFHRIYKDAQHEQTRATADGDTTRAAAMAAIASAAQLDYQAAEAQRVALGFSRLFDD